jgi:hypothetical protein
MAVAPLMSFFSFWASWGYPFVQETYLYHLHRLDHRHNFSPYFYQIYLNYPSISTSAVARSSMWSAFIRSPLTSFLTQLILSLSSGLFFIRTRRDMIMGWFIQTATFVIFNKVCTSQVCAMFFISSLRRLTVMSSIAVFPLVYVISTAHYSLPVMVMAFGVQISCVLDGDTSIVAQSGVQGGIFRGTHFLSSVDLQCHLHPWTQLGTRGHCK